MSSGNWVISKSKEGIHFDSEISLSSCLYCFATELIEDWRSYFFNQELYRIIGIWFVNNAPRKDTVKISSMTTQNKARRKEAQRRKRTAQETCDGDGWWQGLVVFPFTLNHSESHSSCSINDVLVCLSNSPSAAAAAAAVTIAVACPAICLTIECNGNSIAMFAMAQNAAFVCLV